ncbi:hypothetical protein BH11GEM2_BH11GEM2_04900 [soil metagenome]
MPIKSHRIPKRVGTYTPRVRAAATQVEENAEATAKATLFLAQLTYTMVGEGLSYRHIARLLLSEPYKTACGGLAVSASWLHALRARYEKGEQSIQDYYPKPRGRSCGHTHPQVLERINTLALGRGVHAPMTELLVEINDWIRESGIGEEIGYERFKGIIHRIGRGARTSAAFGSRAGELHGTYHATVACKHTHDIWTVDAFDAPWINKVLIVQLGVWVFVRPAIIVVLDYKSGAVLGYSISNPARRRDVDGNVCTSGFDSDDVIAALMSAAIPGLATAGTHGLSGRLCRQLRWDRHAVNEHLRGTLESVAKELTIQGDSFYGKDEQPETHMIPRRDGTIVDTLIHTPQLPTRRPKNRGDIEITNRIVQRMCWGMSGHMDHDVPAPMWKDEMWKRTTGAAVGAPEPQRHAVAIEHVPTLEESRLEFDKIVQRRNDTRNRITGQTPRERYRAFMPHTARRGDDILALLETHTAFVKEVGIEIQHGGVSTLFEPVIREAGIRYQLDATVTCKVDPFYRFLFVRVGHETHLLPPKDSYWSDEHASERAAREQRAQARADSDRAKTIWEREHDARHGVGAAEAGRVQATEYEAAQREENKRAKDAPPRVGDDAQGAPLPLAPDHVPPRPVGTMDEVFSGPVRSPADVPLPAYERTHTQDARPRVSHRVAQSRASMDAKIEHDARVTGEVARAAEAPSSPPPAPIRTVNEEPAIMEGAAPATRPFTDDEAAELRLPPMSPLSNVVDLTINLVDDFADQYRRCAS